MCAASRRPCLRKCTICFHLHLVHQISWASELISIFFLIFNHAIRHHPILLRFRKLNASAPQLHRTNDSDLNVSWKEYRTPTLYTLGTQVFGRDRAANKSSDLEIWFNSTNCGCEYNRLTKVCCAIFSGLYCRIVLNGHIWLSNIPLQMTPNTVSIIFNSNFQLEFSTLLLDSNQ